LRLTSPIHCNDAGFHRHRGQQAFAVVFVVGPSSALEPGNDDTLLDWGDLYVLAETPEDALRLAREALATRNGGRIGYTVVGVFYVDQLLGMAQCAHRTTAGILEPTNATNSDNPPHEYAMALWSQKPSGGSSKPMIRASQISLAIQKAGISPEMH
jgi:hypothetical protein